jgi:large subunit ribosomal protein L3
VQIGYEDIAPRRSTMPVIGHDHRAGTAPKRFHREVRMDDVDVELGETITVECFEDVQFVDLRTEQGQGVPGRHEASSLRWP